MRCKLIKGFEQLSSEQRGSMSGRKPLPIIQQEAEILSDAKIGQSILNAIPDVAVILNDHRQIVAANQHCIDVLGLESVQLLLGIRPGDALKCIHSLQGTDGCGTGPACGQCGANLAIHKAFRSFHGGAGMSHNNQ